MTAALTLPVRACVTRKNPGKTQEFLVGRLRSLVGRLGVIRKNPGKTQEFLASQLLQLLQLFKEFKFSEEKKKRETSQVRGPPPAKSCRSCRSCRMSWLQPKFQIWSNLVKSGFSDFTLREADH
jgi:hypothetical protein